MHKCTQFFVCAGSVLHDWNRAQYAMRCIPCAQNKGWKFSNFYQKQNKYCFFFALDFNVHTMAFTLCGMHSALKQTHHRHQMKRSNKFDFNSIWLLFSLFKTHGFLCCFRPRHVHLFIYLKCCDFCSQWLPISTPQLVSFRKALTCFLEGDESIHLFAW